MKEPYSNYSGPYIRDPGILELHVDGLPRIEPFIGETVTLQGRVSQTCLALRARRDGQLGDQALGLGLKGSGFRV